MNRREFLATAAVAPVAAKAEPIRYAGAVQGPTIRIKRDHIEIDLARDGWRWLRVNGETIAEPAGPFEGTLGIEKKLIRKLLAKQYDFVVVHRNGAEMYITDLLKHGCGRSENSWSTSVPWPVSGLKLKP